MFSNHDNLIIKLFFTRKNGTQINGNITTKVKKKYPNILHYIEKRYDDSSSIKETLGRIKSHIEIRPKCKYCHKGYVSYYGLNNGKAIFFDFCCHSCMSLGTRSKAEQTSLNRHGVKHFPNTKKAKKTCLEKYGVDNPLKSEKIKEKLKETCLEKYGSTSPLGSKIIYNKTKETLKKNYGVDSPGKSKEIQNRIKTTMLSRYGVASVFSLKSFIEKSHSKEVINKINEAKRKNHTFNTSKFEEEMFSYIKEKFPSVKRQYKDNIRYPWRCDFYIPELDYFIEIQGYYTHNTHPYNPNSILDQVLVQRYKERYGPKCQAITIWTIKDPEKRDCAKHNHLNFKEIWTLEEGKKFIDFLYEMYK